MKHIKLFENYLDKYRIEYICKEYDIKNYTINQDGTVDVDGNVNLYYCELTRLPHIQFGKVTGNFDCGHNKLISLDGSPREVGGDFNCDHNKLRFLEGGPITVGGDFNCAHNDLVTLDGSPKEIGGNFECFINPIHDIYKLFGDYKTYQDSLDYNYLRISHIVKSRFKEALDEIGKELPEKIEGYKYI